MLRIMAIGGFEKGDREKQVVEGIKGTILDEDALRRRERSR
jgi:hypothetical protein